jgi:hypothetical protein
VRHIVSSSPTSKWWRRNMLTHACALITNIPLLRSACVVPLIRFYYLVYNFSGPMTQQPSKPLTANISRHIETILTNHVRLVVIGVMITLWSSLEINISIVCASIPPLKALFNRIIPHLDYVTGYGSSSNKLSRSRGQYTDNQRKESTGVSRSTEVQNLSISATCHGGIFEYDEESQRELVMHRPVDGLPADEKTGTCLPSPTQSGHSVV